MGDTSIDEYLEEQGVQWRLGLGPWSSGWLATTPSRRARPSRAWVGRLFPLSSPSPSRTIPPSRALPWSKRRTKSRQLAAGSRPSALHKGNVTGHFVGILEDVAKSVMGRSFLQKGLTRAISNHAANLVEQLRQRLHEQVPDSVCVDIARLMDLLAVRKSQAATMKEARRDFCEFLHRALEGSAKRAHALIQRRIDSPAQPNPLVVDGLPHGSVGEAVPLAAMAGEVVPRPGLKLCGQDPHSPTH